MPKSYSFPLAFQSEETGNTFLPRLWAMRRIAYLTDMAHENSNNREVIDEIVTLSQKYGIISEFTSFLVTDRSENARLAQNRPVPAMVGGIFNASPRTFQNSILIEITFASKEYFDLIHAKPAIAKYLSIGKQTILQFDGQFYKIILSKIS